MWMHRKNTRTSSTPEPQQPATRRRWWHRRGPRLAVASVILGLGLATASLVAAPAAPAQAIDLFGCSADQTFAVPNDPGTVGLSAERTVVGGFTYYVPAGSTPTGYPDVTGMNFSSFGVNPCTGFLQGAIVSGANLIWEGVAVLPVQLLGAVMNIIFGGWISNLLIGAAGTVSSALYQNLFLRWAPVPIMAVLIVSLFRVARRRGEALSHFYWMVGVLVAVGVLASPAGVNLAQDAQDVVGNVAVCAMLAPSGGCVTGSAAPPSAQFAQALLGRTWGVTVLGPLAEQPMPSQLDFKKNADLPNISHDWTVAVPLSVIPAAKQGQPTWAESWRWTGEYTEAESSMIADGTTGAKCSFTGSSPNTDTLSDPGNGLDRAEPCVGKLTIRAAMLATMQRDYPASYQAASGSGWGSITGAFSGISTLPVVIAMVVIGLFAVRFQVEFILWFIAAPFYGLFAIFRPNVGRKWGENIFASLFKQIGVAFTLGLTIWAISVANAKITAIFAGVGGVAPTMSVQSQPWVIGVVDFLILFAGWKILGKIQEMFAQSAGTTPPSEEGGGVRKAAMLATGAAAGAFSAGPGMRWVGAGRAMLRTGFGRGTGSHGQAIAAGHRAGLGARRDHAAELGVQGAEDVTTVDDLQARLSDSWRDVMNAPELDEARRANVRAAEATLQAAQDELRLAEARQASAQENAAALEAQDAARLRGDGLSAEAAATEARARTVERLAAPQAAYDSAMARVTEARVVLGQAENGAGTPLAGDVQAAIAQGAGAEQVLARFGLVSEEARSAVRAYEQAVRAERRRLYSNER